MFSSAPINSILVWFRPRKLPEGYKGVKSIPRTAPGSDLRQRPRDQKVEPLEQTQYDHVYRDGYFTPGRNQIGGIPVH